MTKDKTLSTKREGLKSLAKKKKKKPAAAAATVIFTQYLLLLQIVSDPCPDLFMFKKNRCSRFMIQQSYTLA